MREVSYEELRSGEIKIKGKQVPTSSLSSLYKARQVSEVLKSWILKGEFRMQEPVQNLPKDRALRTLDVRTEREAT